MWAGRFSDKPDKLMQEFSESVSYDRRLWREDIQGSRAYARELHRISVLNDDELRDILRGFDQIEGEIEKNKFNWKVELEDVHMNIEARLTEIIGDAGKKLHTGRSRNDQVATDFRLWCAKRSAELINASRDLVAAIVARAEANPDVVIPAYTHLQRAMPVTMAHHLLAYAHALRQDSLSFLNGRFAAMAECPLGSAACSGNSFPVDMGRLAAELGFERPAFNSMDAVSSRDFALYLVFACTRCMTHMSRIAEDLILWSSTEFGFVTLGDTVTTGSSIMPQKRNPDACELIRGKTGRVLGHLTALFTTLKGLPMTYNRDLQEDKEAVFDATDQTLASLRVMTLVFGNKSFTVNKDRIAEQLDSGAGYMEAMNVADWLVEGGVPFRTAHDITGKLVKYCEKNNLPMSALTTAHLKSVDERLTSELLKELSLEALVERKTGHSGTARTQVEARLKELKDWLGN